MALTPVSFGATNIHSGVDADKPANPKAGNQYLATDTKILYVCYDSGTWVNAAPPVPDLIIVTPGTTYTLKSINDEKTVNLNNGTWFTLYDFTVSEFKNISAVSGFRLEWESKGAATSYSYRIRLLINDVLIGSDYGTNTGYNKKAVISTTPLVVGDNVKIQGTIDNTGVTGLVGIKNIQFKGDITPEIVLETESGFIELT